MNFNYSENINNETFSATLQFASYGSLGLSPEDEEALLTDFPVELVYSDITFSGKYGLDVNKNVIVDNTTGDTVNIVIPNKRVLLDNKFNIVYSINVNQVVSTELGTKLTTPEDICIAKCRLFRDAVIAKITTLLTAVRAKSTDFAKSTIPTNITI